MKIVIDEPVNVSEKEETEDVLRIRFDYDPTRPGIDVFVDGDWETLCYVDSLNKALCVLKWVAAPAGLKFNH